MKAVQGCGVDVDCTDRPTSASARIGLSRHAAVANSCTCSTLALGRVSTQALHGDLVPQEVSEAIGRATEAAAHGGHAAVVERLLAWLKACGEEDRLV